VTEPHQTLGLSDQVRIDATDALTIASDVIELTADEAPGDQGRLRSPLTQPHRDAEYTSASKERSSVASPRLAAILDRHTEPKR